jgi:hypothetical protein
MHLPHRRILGGREARPPCASGAQTRGVATTTNWSLRARCPRRSRSRPTGPGLLSLEPTPQRWQSGSTSSNATNPRGSSKRQLSSRAGWLHGSHSTVRIASGQAFAEQRTYFTMGRANEDLARILALHARCRIEKEGGVAIIAVQVDEKPPRTVEAMARVPVRALRCRRSP